MLQGAKKWDKQIKVSFSGRLYGWEAKEIMEIFTERIHNGQKTFLLDISRVNHIDDTLIEMLVLIQRQIIHHGGKLKLVGLQERVKEEYELICRAKMFEISIEQTSFAMVRG